VSEPPYGSSRLPDQPDGDDGGQPDPGAARSPRHAQPQDPAATQRIPRYPGASPPESSGPAPPPRYPGPTAPPGYSDQTQPLGAGADSTQLIPRYADPMRPPPPPGQPGAPPPGQPPPGQWGAAPPPSQWSGPPPSPGRQRPRPNRPMIVLLAIIGVLVAGGVAAVVLANSDTTKHDAKQTSQPTTPGATSAPDFPTGGSTDSSTDSATTSSPSASTGSDRASPAVQASIAHNAEAVLHGLGNDQPTAFCPLIDPADLQRLLKEKHLTRCNDIRLSAATDRTEYRQFMVTDPSAIAITGDSAEIPPEAITPSIVGTVDMRKDADGTWKFRFYPN
jgi:hypothetical protein